jgi:T4 RnlA family RNA ligase
MKLKKYLEFIKEEVKISNYIPTYEDCVEICSQDESPFYETKLIVDGFSLSVFNYRLVKYSDFITPIPFKPEISGIELRGLTFVFNQDGSLFKRFLLLEKFFNLNQVPESMYSIVKDYKIKWVNNKEDGSIASYIQLPNGKVLGKSKMGFDNEQANGINRIYKTRTDVKTFVDWCLQNGITSIFEYVSPANRIVLRYLDEDLILLRMRDNTTGKHLDIKNYLDKVGTIRIAPFEDDHKDLDSLVEVIAKQVDKEGVIVQAEDKYGKDFFFKIKTPWYINLHSLHTNDLNHEDKIIKLIIDEKIDDIICELEEDDYLRKRIDKIISIVKKFISKKVERIHNLYDIYKRIGSIKEFAINYNKSEDFSETMKYIRNRNISLEELAKDWIIKNTNRLEKAREFIENNKTIL